MPTDSCHFVFAAPAGVALVESAGDALVQTLLPQFESYLEPSAASKLGLAESRYDLVREGVVVLLGMMAGHLAPADDKVRRTCLSGGGGVAIGLLDEHCVQLLQVDVAKLAS
jgi:hypothetical protein